MVTPAKLTSRLFKLRWLASIFLLILLDVATYLALSRTGGTQLFDNQDKLMHVVGFAGLFTAGHLSLNYDFFPKIRKFSVWLLLLNASIWFGYGVVIEFLQKFSGYRYFSMADLIANGIGIFIGAVLVNLLRLYPEKDQDIAHEP